MCSVAVQLDPNGIRDSCGAGSEAALDGKAMWPCLCDVFSGDVFRGACQRIRGRGLRGGKPAQ
eukprot:3671752-Prymnesium_polylepis.1